MLCNSFADWRRGVLTISLIYPLWFMAHASLILIQRSMHPYFHISKSERPYLNPYHFATHFRPVCNHNRPLNSYVLASPLLFIINIESSKSGCFAAFSSDLTNHPQQICKLLYEETCERRKWNALIIRTWLQSSVLSRSTWSKAAKGKIPHAF
jgi:hypothetical protein